MSIDDWAPAAGQTRAWVQACGIDPDRLHRLSLSRRYAVFRGTPGPAGRATAGAVLNIGCRPQVQPPKRSSAEYERLARQILADPRWVAAESLCRRKRERVRARLIDAALAGDPALPAVMLPTRALGDPKRFRFRETARRVAQSHEFRFTQSHNFAPESHNSARDFDRRHD